MTLKEANSLDLLLSAIFKFIHSTCYQDREYVLLICYPDFEYLISGLVLEKLLSGLRL